MKKILIALSLLCSLSGISQCITVNSSFFTNPSGDNRTFDLHINWSASGVNHLETFVFSGQDTVFTACVQVSNSTPSSGTSIYSGIVAPGGYTTLSALFTRWTSSCNSGTKCGSDQSIPAGGVLDIKFEKIVARHIDKYNTEIKFKVASVLGEKTASINLRMKNGSIKKYPVIMPSTLRPGDWWKVILNHKTGQYQVTKL